jgi:signal transduction histidine kinase
MALGKNGKTRGGASKSAARRKTGPKRWPSEAEQTLEALRAGLIDALVIPEGPRDRVYALKTFEELEQANKDLRESQERLLVLLSERERLMQDLHDGCIQSIYAVGLTLEDCRGLITKNPVDAMHKVARAEANLNLVIQELRAFISGNTPQAPLDLADEIGRTIEALGAHAPMFTIDIDTALARSLPPEQTAQLLQIAREGVSNIVRHAKAKSGRVSLRQRGHKVQLEVSDDGEGFDAGSDKQSGLGLHHIAARVQKLGGRLRVHSNSSQGSRIIVEVPAI